MRKAVGVDIGGTNIKAGIVDSEGNIEKITIVPTSDYFSSEVGPDTLIHFLKQFDSDEIEGIGVSIPGLLSTDRKVPFDVTAIPALDQLPLHEILTKEFPGKSVSLENDANAATWAEFSLNNKGKSSLLLVTLGTGIGSGLVYKNKLFYGENGNALELGETLSSNGEKLENRIGLAGILNIAKNFGSFATVEEIIFRANSGDESASRVLFETGQILGQGLVNFIRLFDLTNIALGGGVSEGYIFIKQGIEDSLKSYLTSYYLSNVNINKAVLANNAGIIGSAMLSLTTNQIYD